MKKEEFKQTLESFFVSKFGIKFGSILPNNFNKLLESTISQSIAEHEASQWKKYPENKPKKAGWYLITDDEENIEADLWNNTDWANNPFVIAFRELPKPYQEERQSFGSLNGCHNCKHQDNDDVCKKCDDTLDKWEGGEK